MTIHIKAWQVDRNFRNQNALISTFPTHRCLWNFQQHQPKNQAIQVLLCSASVEESHGFSWMLKEQFFCLIYTVVISIFSSTLSLELRSISSSQPRLQKKQLQNLNANICQTQWGTRSGDAGSCCSAARRRLLGILRSWSSYSSSALHHGTCCQGIVTKLLMLMFMGFGSLNFAMQFHSLEACMQTLNDFFTAVVRAILYIYRS